MSSIYNLDDPPRTEDEREELRRAQKELIEAQREYLRVWRKRAFYSTAAFFLSCASIYPFVYGHPLHAYWEHFGKYLLLLSAALFLPMLVCVGIAVETSDYLRKVEKMDPWSEEENRKTR